MPALSPLCLAALALIAALSACAGCSRTDAPTPTRRASEGATLTRSVSEGVPGTSEATPPGALELPPHLHSFAPAEQRAAYSDRAALAAYQQADAESASGPRITALSATPSATSPELIREPLARDDTLPASPPSEPEPEPASLRSQFVPVDMPPEDSRMPEDRLPELPPRPDVSEPTTAPALVGPQLGAPTAAPEAPQYVSSGPSQYEPLTDSAVPPESVSTYSAAAAPTPQAPDRSAMQPVAQRAAETSERAFGMARRGMLYAARAELVQSMQLIAQALDVQQGTSTHAAALTAGLTALEEAQDFAPASGRLGEAANVAEIAKAHRTPVLKAEGSVSPVVAQQQYFTYAQAQLVAAAGNEPVGSLSLYRLGKLQVAMAEKDSETHGLQGPKAMVFYQASLVVDSRNYMAANELGVLMAKYGQLHEARRLLVHSVTTQPHVEGWHNLAVVHKRLGEADLAQRADHERQLLAQAAPPNTALGGNVAWVDPKAFAAQSGPEAPWPENVVRRSAAGQGSETARAASPRTVRGSASFGAKR